MIRKLTLLLPLILAAPLAAQQFAAQQFGEPLTLKEEVKISDILAKPDAYNGKLVMVRGTVLDVCPHMGCWIKIASDKRFQSIRFKVEDGAIVFPESLKGKEVVAEGRVAVLTPDTTGENNEAKEKAPVTVRINGLGATAK